MVNRFEHDTTYSDEDLCRLARSDVSAEEALLLRYRRRVLMSTRSFFLLGGDNEDLIQEGMVGLLKAIRSYDSQRGAAFRTYADRCINHALVSAVQSAARSKHSPLNTSVSLENPLFDGNPDYLYGQADQFASDPESMMILREEVQERLGLIHSQLSGFEAKVLGLYLTGMSYAQIAAQVNRSVKSVDNAVQRVRRKLSHQVPHSDSSSC